MAILMILIAVLLAVFGQILVKMGLNASGGINFSSGFVWAYVQLFMSPKIIIGTISYTVSIFFWLYALSRVDLSFAYPFLAVSYVLIVLASWLLLGEQVPMLRWAGVLAICFGVLLVAIS